MHATQNLYRSQQLLLLSTWLERSTPRICFLNALRLARNIYMRCAPFEPCRNSNFQLKTENVFSEFLV